MPVIDAPEAWDEGSVGSGAGGGASVPSGGDGGGGAPATPVGACPADVAFRAAGVSFTEPTSSSLAAALGAALYGYDAHGISVVVQGDALTASATVAGEAGAHMLVGAPPSTAALVTPGGIRTVDPQPTGFIRVVDDEGVVDIELRTITLDARTGDDCSQVFVVLDAVVPVEMGSTTITLAGESATIAELAGSSPDIAGWQLRALFVGESIDFDFAGQSS